MVYSDTDYRIAFSMVHGVNLNTGRQLLDKVGSEREFFEYGERELKIITGLNDKHVSADSRKELLMTAYRENMFCQTAAVNPLYFTDDDYPQRLLECGDAPVLVYSLGPCNLNARRVVSIVGTRHCTAYGQAMTGRIVRSLAEKVSDLVIVSGLAYGIDVTAHRAAMENGVPTVGVLAHPLNRLYPPEHRDVAVRMVKSGGALVSEYPTPLADNTRAYTFLQRNRIIAGLSDITIVVESDRRGGSMATARCAMEYNRDVFAVPGRIGDKSSRGCNLLIANDTARILDDIDEFADQLGWTDKHSEGRQGELILQLSDEQQQILNVLKTNPDFTVNDIVRHTGKSYSFVTEQLFSLEMAGMVLSVPGGRFAIL